MAELGIVREINCAHGKTIHGHTFKVEVIFEGKVINDMVADIDFHDIKDNVNKVLDLIDRTYLDEVEGIGKATVENIAIYILKKFNEFDSLSSVTVWEGPNQYAKVFADEVRNEK